MDTADIQGKLLAYFNQLSPEARDRLLASAPAQEAQPQPASGSGNAQPGQTLPTKAPPPVVTGQAQAQSPESDSTPNSAPDASASSLLADELADLKKSASTRRGQKAKALTRKDWDFIDPAQSLSWSPDQIRRAHGDGRVIPSLVFKKDGVKVPEALVKHIANTLPSTEAETSPSAQPGPLPSVSETRPAWADIQEDEALNKPLPISSDSPVIEEAPPAPPAKSTPPSPGQSLPSEPTSKAAPEPEARPSASPTKPNPRMTMVYEGRTWHNFWGQDPPANAISVDWDSFWFTLEEEPTAAQPKGPPSCPPPAHPPQQAQESHQPPGTKAPPPPMPQEPEPAHKKIKCSVFGADGWILRKDQRGRVHITEADYASLVAHADQGDPRAQEVRSLGFNIWAPQFVVGPVVPFSIISPPPTQPQSAPAQEANTSPPTAQEQTDSQNAQTQDDFTDLLGLGQDSSDRGLRNPFPNPQRTGGDFRPKATSARSMPCPHLLITPNADRRYRGTLIMPSVSSTWTIETAYDAYYVGHRQ
ncbi:unnamed protein product, partial [Symbiodinium natans]